MKGTAIRVLVADDQKHERIGFVQLLCMIEGIDVVGDASSTLETIVKAQTLQPDVLLLDLAWYDDKTAGESVIRELKSTVPKVKILVATAYPELIPYARAAGAEVAVSKGMLKDESSIRAHILETFEYQVSTTVLSPLPEPLTEREIEILDLIAHGSSNKEIGKMLYLAEGTVKKIREDIFDKLGVKNAPEAVYEATRRKLLPPKKD